MIHWNKWFLALVAITFSTLLFSQAPANALGGYANVDNNLNKVPRIFFGLSLGGEYREALSLRTGAHLKIRGDRFGEFQVSGTYTPDFLITVPAKPFGNNNACNCADNAFTDYKDLDASYTFYIKRIDAEKNYKVRIKNPGLSFSEKFALNKGESEKIPGQVSRFYGVRLGAAYQQGSFYTLSTKRTIAFSGFEQRVAYLGISRTSIGRMFRNFEGVGIRGKNIHTQFYADAFYAIDQNFTSTPVLLYDSQGRLRTEGNQAIPYGFRVGVSSYNYGFRSKFAIYSTLEAGVRPTFVDAFNGLYVNLKIGVGIGAGKTPVYYITSRQNKVYGRTPNLEGNGKYRERKSIGKTLHKRKPLKMIRHRYGR